MHSVLEQLDGDFHGYDESVFDVGFDELAKLGAGTLLLCAEEVAG